MELWKVHCCFGPKVVPRYTCTEQYRYLRAASAASATILIGSVANSEPGELTLDKHSPSRFVDLPVWSKHVNPMNDFCPSQGAIKAGNDVVEPSKRQHVCGVHWNIYISAIYVGIYRRPTRAGGVFFFLGSKLPLHSTAFINDLDLPLSLSSLPEFSTRQCPATPMELQIARHVEVCMGPHKTPLGCNPLPLSERN